MSPEERDALILRIIESEINCNAGEDDWYLRSILYNGFRGYAAYSDEELIELAEGLEV